MLKAKKLLYLFSLATLIAGGCCFPSIPLCNECLFGAIEAFATLVGAFQGTTPV